MFYNYVTSIYFNKKQIGVFSMASESPSYNGKQLSAQQGSTAIVERWCILCGTEDGQMLQYGNINVTERTFITKHSDQPNTGNKLGL